MISEILDILGIVSDLPSKDDKPNNSKRNILIYIWYLISIIAFIFLIPELKKIVQNENAASVISLLTVISVIFALLVILLLQKINLLEQQTFSKFITLLISIFVIFLMSTCLLFNSLYF